MDDAQGTVVRALKDVFSLLDTSRTSIVPIEFYAVTNISFLP